MFNNNYNKNIFSGEHRLERHLELIVDKLQGIDVPESFSVGDIFANKKLNEKVSRHCACMELCDPIVSHYPDVNMQMLYMCLREGAGLDKLNLIGHNGIGLRNSIEQGILRDGWSALDGAFVNLYSAEAGWLQKNIATYLFDQEKKRERVYYPETRYGMPGLCIMRGLEACLMAIAAEHPDYHYVEIERMARSDIQAFVGSCHGSYDYLSHAPDRVHEVAVKIRRHHSIAGISFCARMRVLDGLMNVLSKYFVSSWIRRGVGLDELNTALDCRLNALIEVFGAPSELRGFLMQSARFIALYPYQDQWTTLGISWSHGLGLPLGLSTFYEDRGSLTEQGVMSPLDDMPRMSHSALSGAENTLIFRGLHKALLTGEIDAHVYANRYGSFMPSSYVMSTREGHAVLHNISKHSQYLKTIIPAGLCSEYMVATHPFEDTYRVVLESIVHKALSSRGKINIRLGSKACTPFNLIGWLNEEKRGLVLDIFKQVSRNETGNMVELIQLLDISADNFSERDLCSFTYSVKRALIGKDFGI
jgi:hypothetical protein